MRFYLVVLIFLAFVGMLAYESALIADDFSIQADPETTAVMRSWSEPPHRSHHSHRQQLSSASADSLLR